MSSKWIAREVPVMASFPFSPPPPHTHKHPGKHRYVNVKVKTYYRAGILEKLGLTVYNVCGVPLTKCTAKPVNSCECSWSCICEIIQFLMWPYSPVVQRYLKLCGIKCIPVKSHVRCRQSITILS